MCTTLLNIQTENENDVAGNFTAQLPIVPGVCTTDMCIYWYKAVSDEGSKEDYH
jgi:hypothetical protein